MFWLRNKKINLELPPLIWRFEVLHEIRGGVVSISGLCIGVLKFIVKIRGGGGVRFKFQT